MARPLDTPFIIRRIIHISWGGLLLLIYLVLHPLATAGIWAWALAMVLLDWGRNRLPFWQHRFYRWFGWMLKSPEMQGRMTGATWLVLAAAMLITFFPSYFLPSMLILTFGDTLAALLGRWQPLIFIHRNKSLMGALVMFSVSAIVLWNVQPTTPLVNVLGALTVTIVELIAPETAENVWVGLTPGVFLWLVSGG
ncbi:MAG: hypothetical protein GXO78_03740 [Calditrichaeota bacterium]|nr:hypothetical protein [Calditrichota bacterium]